MYARLVVGSDRSQRARRLLGKARDRFPDRHLCGCVVRWNESKRARVDRRICFHSFSAKDLPVADAQSLDTILCSIQVYEGFFVGATQSSIALRKGRKSAHTDDHGKLSPAGPTLTARWPCRLCRSPFSVRASAGTASACRRSNSPAPARRRPQRSSSARHSRAR